MSTCLCVQCSSKSPSSAEIFFSFIMIAFVYSLSMAFSSSYGGNGDQLQQSVIALLVVVYIYPYLVTCAALGQSCAAVFLFIAVNQDSVAEEVPQWSALPSACAD